MPYPASAIAYAFVKKAIEAGESITQMKVQKMVYFAHGYHLAKYGKPLIQESFEAWKFGPVVPNIYQDFKFYGSKPISDSDYEEYAPKELVNYRFDEDAEDAINYTWEVTKDLSAIALSNWTHQPNSPWSNVYNPEEWSTLIDNYDIKEYFKELLSTDHING